MRELPGRGPCRDFAATSTLRSLRAGGLGLAVTALVPPLDAGAALDAVAAPVATSSPPWATNYALLSAQLSGLALVAAAALGLLLLAACAYSALDGRRKHARRWFAGAVGVGVVYLGTLFGLALLSRDRTLPPGGEKYFCELDCHLAYAVEASERLGAAVGIPGTVWSVVVRARFDERTTAPSRPRDAPVRPNPLRAWVEDDRGERHEGSEAAERALPLGDEDFAPLDRPLLPGESYRARLAFVLPPGRRPVRLLLADREWFQRLVLDNEASPWHGRVWLRLPS
ncbi:MAG: hypothetical protein KDB94_10120 [Acidobacteria bacterium]|nr:hypothetical protein [Acidobacteriota bacterium]MCB9378212.1 hypothetical protein [Holophagales bacterium]